MTDEKYKTVTLSEFTKLLQRPEVQKLVVEDAIRRVNHSALFADPYSPPPKPLTRWQRIRYGVRNAVSSARMRLGSWIAGVNLDSEDRW